MNLRQMLHDLQGKDTSERRDPFEHLYEEFGVTGNPFPASNQNFDNPHYPLDADKKVEKHIRAFVLDGKSQALVIKGTQGVGKTNFMRHFEDELQDVMEFVSGSYVIKYLADPEASFAGTIRRLFEELGADHLAKLINVLKKDNSAIYAARSHEVRIAFENLCRNSDRENLNYFMEWIQGGRLLKVHRTSLGVQFRLDTVESKTASLRDFVQVSAKAGVLHGIFLLLDELEKQDGSLGPTAVVRYLSAIRAIVDALPQRLFLMIAITPDALLRYSAALPALKGRLENQVELSPLNTAEEAVSLANFYVETARSSARLKFSGKEGGNVPILAKKDLEERFYVLAGRLERRADVGVTQREYLHELYLRADDVIQKKIDEVGDYLRE